jgi:hypothetical protein
MNRKILLTVLALLAVAMLATSVNTALATTTYVDNEHAGGSCVIGVPDSSTPWVRLVVYGLMKGNYYSGIANRFMIYVRTGGSDTGPTFTPVAGYENNAVRSAFSASLGFPTVEHVVKDWQIGVFRVGKCELVYWTIPLQVPVTPHSTTVVTIPPGMMILKGYGDKLYNSVSATMGGVSVTYSYHYYLADATVFSGDWKPVGGLVTSLPGVVVDRVWTWTLP